MVVVCGYRRIVCLRPDTNDAATWDAVYARNQYAVGDMTGRTVLDVGGHVGSFAARCMDNGAKVISVEPSAGNALIFRDVLREEIAEGRCELIEAAAWSCSGKGRLIHGCAHGKHTDHSLIFYREGREGTGEEVPLVSFAALLETYRPDAVKLDCEGGEYPILLGQESRQPIELPGYVRTVWVEFHATMKLWPLYQRCLARMQAMEFAAELLTQEENDCILLKFER